MKRINPVFILFCLSFIGVSACKSITTAVDYDTHANFDTYQSFAFYEDMETGLSPLDERRISASLTNILSEKGFRQNSNPELKVNFYGTFYRETHHNSIGIGIGTYGSHAGGNIAGGIPIKSTKHFLHLSVELIDTSKNLLVWQGVVDVQLSRKLKPQERQERLHKALKKLFKKFPPSTN